MYALECHHIRQQLADTTTELSTCRSQLTDQQRQHDDLIAERDETIRQLNSDSQLLQQRVNIASRHSLTRHLNDLHHRWLVVVVVRVSDL